MRGELDGALLELAASDGVESVGTICYDLLARRVGDELLVRGDVQCCLELTCCRCAVFFSTNCGDSSFLRAFPLGPESDVVELAEELREAVVLNVPFYPVCGHGCRGLCSRCGKNWNEGPCECEAPRDPSPWLALDGLNLDDGTG